MLRSQCLMWMFDWVSLFLQVQGGDVKIKAVHADFSVLAICEMSQDVQEDTSTELHLQLLGTNLLSPSFCYSSPSQPTSSISSLKKRTGSYDVYIVQGWAPFVVVVVCLSRSFCLPSSPSAFTRYFFDFLRGFFCEGNPSEWDNAA